MTGKSPRKLFVNLPIRDLQRSVAFFTRLGFTFNQQFTDDKATCMVVSEETQVMLLVEERFKDFTKKPLADARAATGAIYAISVDDRAEVDALVQTALSAGATIAADPMDHGFMYVRSFYDLDGHHWEVFFMDMSAMPKE